MQTTANPTIKSDHFHLFIGFGGAGHKVLTNLAECISRDFDASKQADMKYSFVLIDSDEGELDDSMTKIRKSLSYAVESDRLMIQTLKLGNTFDASFGDTVSRTFQRMKSTLGADSQEFKTFQAAWWTQADTAFTFPGVVDPRIGLSQMPLASRVAAMYCEERIKDIAREVASEYIRRHLVRETPVEMYVVSSLAGGTGRGCWSTLSFMFRAAFARERIQCKPYGMFLDAGVFDNAEVDDQQTRNRMRLNSLTGVSELVMFLRNSWGYERGESNRSFIKRKEKLNYVVESLSGAAPLIDPANLQATKGEYQENRHGSPVDGAIFLFKGNDHVPDLSHPEEYYKLAGQTLYIAVEDHEFRSKFWNNMDGTNLTAVASSVASVPARDVMDYISTLKRYLLFNRDLILRNTEGVQTNSAKLIGTLGIEGVSQWYQTVAKEYGDFINLKSRIYDHLTNDQLSDALSAVGELESLEYTCTELSNPALLTNRIVSGVMDCLKKDRKAPDFLTLGECCEVLGKLKTNWGKLSGPRLESPTIGIDALACAIEAASGREGLMGLYGKRFTQIEIDAIIPLVVDFWEKRSQRIVNELVAKSRPQVAKLVDEALGFVNRVREDLRSMEADLLEEVKKKESTFVRLDEGTASEILVQDVRFSMNARVNYVIRPPLDNVEIQEITDHIFGDWEVVDNSEIKRAESLIQVARVAICEGAWAEAAVESPWAGAMQARSKIRAAYVDALELLRCNPEFIERHFSLSRVLEKYVAKLPAAYEVLQHSERENFNQNVYRVFGLNLEQRRPIDVRSCAASLAAFIAANCHPFARFSSRADQNAPTSSVKVFMPSIDGWNIQADAVPLFFASPIAQERKLGAESRPDYRVVDIEEWTRSPFSINAMSRLGTSDWQRPDSEDLGFESLNYWKHGSGNAVLREMLDAAELDPLSEVNKNLAIGSFPHLTANGGIGFIDPRFVGDTEWSKLRWRPWYQGQAEEVKAQGDICFAYLCLGNLSPKDQTNQQVLCVFAKLKSKLWEGPILQRDPEPDKSDWVATRLAYKEIGHVVGKMKAWKRTKQVGNSLWRLSDWYSGVGDADRMLVMKEFKMFRELLTTAVDATQLERSILQNSLREFLIDLRDREVGRWDSGDAKRKKIEDLLDGAVEAADTLLT